MSAVIAVLLQVSAMGLLGLGAVYLFEGGQNTVNLRAPSVIALAFGALVLLAFAEIIHQLSHNRVANERAAKALESLVQARVDRQQPNAP